MVSYTVHEMISHIYFKNRLLQVLIVYFYVLSPFNNRNPFTNMLASKSSPLYFTIRYVWSYSWVLLHVCLVFFLTVKADRSFVLLKIHAHLISFMNLSQETWLSPMQQNWQVEETKKSIFVLCTVRWVCCNECVLTLMNDKIK